MQRTSRYATLGSLGAGNKKPETKQQAQQQGGKTKVVEIKSAEDKKRLLNAKNVVVVDIYGTWCGPCKSVAPRYEELAQKYPNHLFLKEDVDKKITKNIPGVPTFQIYKNKKLVHTVVGGNLAEVEQHINK